MPNIRHLVITAALLIVYTVAAFAALPQTISYQGYVKDSSTNVPLNSNTVKMKFSLYSSTRQESGAVWSETQNVNVSNGIYSVQLGAASPNQAISAPFDVPYWLGVKVGNDQEMQRQPLSATGYAFRAEVAESATTLAGLTPAQIVNPSQQNPTAQQLATLRWDQVRGGSGTYSVGTTPSALAFDGSFIWVANSGSNNVMKLHPATGAVVATVPVGTTPSALAFDGNYIWVANAGSSNIMKINPVTNSVSGTVALSISPTVLAYGGGYVWAGSSGDLRLFRVNVSSGVIEPPSSAYAPPNYLAFDGTYMWTINGTYSSIEKVSLAGTITRLMDYPSLKSLVFDGTQMWLACYYGLVSFPVTGGVPSTISSAQYGTKLAYDGSSIWMVRSGFNDIIRINPLTPTLGPQISVGSNPSAIVFDGYYM